jgi:hypothetical protein
MAEFIDVVTDTLWTSEVCRASVLSPPASDGCVHLPIVVPIRADEKVVRIRYDVIAFQFKFSIGYFPSRGDKLTMAMETRPLARPEYSNQS